MKILVVDDSIRTQNLIKKLLTTNGYEVITATNGAASLDLYARERPEIVLLDITMPLMDGRETLRRMLDLDKNATVIMTTAVDDGEIIQGYLSRGAVGYIVKPFEFAELISTIKNVSTLRNNKSSTTFFSLVRNKIESDLRKMIVPSASIVLNEVEVINQERSPQMFTSRQIDQIRVVPQINQNTGFENIQDYTGYVTEYNGPRNGQVITLVKNNDLGVIYANLTNTLLVKGSYNFDDVVEFFNIINQKIITVLSNAVQLTFSREPIREYDEAKDKPSNWNDVLKATFEIKLPKPISLIVILCSGRRYKEHQ